MARSPEVSQNIQLAQEKRKGIMGRTKEVVLWTAEKSTPVTLGITAVLFFAGKISLPTALVAGGLDIFGSRVARNMRKKDQQRAGTQQMQVGQVRKENFALAA